MRSENGAVQLDPGPELRSGRGLVRLDPGIEIMSQRLAKVEAPCVVATIVSAAGSTYRKPGARMLIEADGRITGLLSGGCLEEDLREHAGKVLSSGLARSVTYDMRSDNDLIFGIGAGCEGCVQILLEPAPCDSRVVRCIAQAGELSRAGEPLALVMIHEGLAGQHGTYLWRSSAESSLPQPLIEACARAVEGGVARECRWQAGSATAVAWVQPVLPLPAILICGAGADAEPLAAAFRALHFPVTVTDHRPAYASPARFPGADVVAGPAATLAGRVVLGRFFAAVVMSHHLASDVEYLRALAGSAIGYVGVLGPRMRRGRLMSELGSVAQALEGRLRGPVGLDIGAVTPEGIALAIASEIHAAAAGHDAQPFRQAEAGR